MDRTNESWTFAEGNDVVSSDGEKVGEVVGVHRNHVVVEQGFFFPTDYYIPTGAIADYDGERITLNVTKDAALDQGWDAVPTDDTAATTTTTDTGGTADTYATETETYATDSQRTASTRVEGDQVLRVPVHEEALSAVTREREVGAVRVAKEVVAEERVLEVPVVEERVRVQRVAVDREAGAEEGAFEEGTIAVPIRGEEVELQKRTRVAEDVEITKEAVQRTEQVSGTVRREEVRVDERGVETPGEPGRTGTSDTTRTP